MTNNIPPTLSGAEYTAIFEQQRQDKADSINNLSKKVGTAFDEMATLSKAMGENQATQKNIREEQAKLYKAKNMLHQSDPNSGNSKKDRLRRLAYYLLPIADVCFAFLCIYPIATSKLAHLGEAIAEMAGISFSIIVGLAISLFGRISLSSLEEGEDWRKAPTVIGVIIILPLMYIVSEIIFNGGQSWAYSICFAFISFMIQCIMIKGFNTQIKAWDIKKSRNNEIRRSIKKTERALNRQTNRLKKEAEALKKDFKKATDNFTAAFRDIVTASDSYLAEYKNSIFIPVGNDARYLGNAICFQREALPICHTDEIVFSKNLKYISYMYNEIGAEISLEEYLDSRESEPVPLSQAEEKAA